MQTVLFVIHIMVIVALIGVVLLQRSEGGGLGIGGGGGGFMTSRGTASVLTRATAILAVLFFMTSLGLAIVPQLTGSHGSILETVKPAAEPTAPAQQGTPVGDGKGGVLNQLNDLVKQQQDKAAQQPANAPVAPAVEVPAAPAPAASEPAPAAATPATGESNPATPAAPATEVPAPAVGGSAPVTPAP
jgi:preprotein translocase subunit SecG